MIQNNKNKIHSNDRKSNIIIEFRDFFINPMSFHNNFGKSRKMKKEMIVSLISLIIPFLTLLLGSFSLIWRKYYYGALSSLFNSNMWLQFGYISILLGIIGIIPFIYILKNSLEPKMNFKEILQSVLYSIRYWNVLWIPFLISFIMLWIGQIIQPIWSLESITIYFVIILHLSLIWYTINIGFIWNKYNRNQNRSIIIAICYILSLIFLEVIISIVFNDVFWESPTIMAFWRNWVEKSIF